MPYPIIWSPRSKITYYNILQYLVASWSQKEIDSFIDRTERVLSLVKNNPFLYTYSKTSDTFKSVIIKQVTLFYRIKGKEVELLIFWDSRQNPYKLKL